MRRAGLRRRTTKIRRHGNEVVDRCEQRSPLLARSADVEVMTSEDADWPRSHVVRSASSIEERLNPPCREEEPSSPPLGDDANGSAVRGCAEDFGRKSFRGERGHSTEH